MKLELTPFAQKYVARIHQEVADRNVPEELEPQDSFDFSDRFTQTIAMQGWLPLDAGKDEDYEKKGTRALLVTNALTALNATGQASLAIGLAMDVAREMITPEMEAAVVEETHQELIEETPLHKDPKLQKEAENYLSEFASVTDVDELEIFVLDRDRDNAAAVGNRVYLESGLLKEERSVILGTIAHELGHVENKDYAQSMAFEALLDILPNLNQRPVAQAIRDTELKADRHMVDTLVAIGEDPIPTIESMRQYEASATHPDGNFRANEMLKHLKESRP